MTQQTLFYRNRYRLSGFLPCLALTGLLFLCSTGSGLAGRDDFSYDIRLLDALDRAGLVNYAMLQVNLLLERYPEREDHIRYSEARFHFSRNRRREAREALAKIPEDSPFFTEASLLTARQAIQRGDLEAAAEAYAAYFDQVDRPASEQPADVEIFTEAVLYYAQTKIEAGEARAAATILERLKNLPEDQAPLEDSINIMVAEAVFAAMNNRQEAGQQIDRGLIEEQVNRLLEVQWRHGGLSRLTAQAFVQAARGYVLLGQPEKALETLQSISEALGRLQQEDPESTSLLPAAFYYFARAHEEIGRQALRRNRNSEAVQAFTRAAAFYNRRLIGSFPDHSYASRAVVRYAQMDELLQERLDRSLPPLAAGLASGFPLRIEEANRFYRAQEFEQAVPLYLEAIRMARGHRDVIDAAQRLVNALGQTGRLLEASAIASYMADFFPEAEATANAMLLAGRAYFQEAGKAEEEGRPEQQQMLTRNAIAIWDSFVETMPQHERAPSIAFFIAEYYYAQAVRLVREGRESQEQQRREQLLEEARETFQRCIPYYQRLLDRYASTPEGLRSLYKLGWVHYNLNQGKQAAELFSRYAVLETMPQHSDDRLRARLHAGEQLMLSDAPRQAINQLRGLLGWYEARPSGIDLTTETAQRIQVDAANYLAWAYDMAAETLRPELREIDRTVEQHRRTVADLENRLQQFEVVEARLEGAIAAAENQWQEVEEEMLAGLPEPEVRAEQELQPSQQQLDAASPEEREQMLRIARQQIRDLARQYRERELANRQGQIGDLEERRRENRRRLDETTEAIARNRERIENHQQRLREAEQSLAELTEEKEGIEEILQSRAGEIEELEKQIEEWRENRRRAEEVARTDSDEARRRRASAAVEQLEERIAAARPRLERQRQQQQERSQRLETRMQALAEQIQQEQETIADSQEAVPRLQRENELLALEKVVAESYLDADNALIPVLQKQVEALRQDRENRTEILEQSSYHANREEAAEHYAKLRENKVARARLEMEYVEEDSAAVKQNLDDLRSEIEKLQERREPIFARLVEKKQEAVGQFRKFLQQYPDSKYAPDHLARIGTIYLEIEQFDEAVTYLNRLAEQFSGHEATGTALFDLGRARFEAGQVDEAVATFGQIADRFDEQNAANLEYLARSSMEADAPELALTALDELLRRAEDPEHPDYPVLFGEQGRYRERLLHRASTAALKAGHYDRARSLAETLLESNERTAYFFQVQMNIALAARQAEPPDFRRAEQALNEILRLAQERSLQSRAIVEYGNTLMMNERRGPDGPRRAVGQFSRLVMIDEGEVVFLADPDDDELRPWIEEAVYRSAYCHALLGNQQRRDLLVAEYRRRFPDGQFLARINTLPEPRFN